MTHWHPTNTQDPATDGMGGNGKSGGVSSPFATLGSLRSATASSGSSNNNGIGAERGEARRGSTTELTPCEKTRWMDWICGIQ